MDKSIDERIEAVEAYLMAQSLILIDIVRRFYANDADRAGARNRCCEAIESLYGPSTFKPGGQEKVQRIVHEIGNLFRATEV